MNNQIARITSSVENLSVLEGCKGRHDRPFYVIGGVESKVAA